MSTFCNWVIGKGRETAPSCDKTTTTTETTTTCTWTHWRPPHRKISKSVQSLDSWLLVDRFCFKALPRRLRDKQSENENNNKKGEGMFKFDVSFKIKDRITVSAFFGDEENWKSVHEAGADDMTCSER